MTSRINMPHNLRSDWYSAFEAGLVGLVIMTHRRYAPRCIRNENHLYCQILRDMGRVVSANSRRMRR
jgi:hypothetical protein